MMGMENGTRVKWFKVQRQKEEVSLDAGRGVRDTGVGERKSRNDVTVKNCLIKFKVFRFNKKNSAETKQRSGCPRTFSEERWIVRQAHINPKTSAVKLTLKCKSRFRKSVNPETVRNVLKKHKYYGRVLRRKPYISIANRKAKLAFAKMYVKQSTEFWKNIIFVDGSKYNIFGSDGNQKVWHTPNTVLHIKNLRATVKYGGANQLVWDCMASSGVGNLDFINVQ
ncbi:hypothetical protein AVEN_265901-1 [Araneus ventricosus]|uniref:Transposase Tc1-like domain-containing protein n=1 Tax=Araneus ventricosus TaxID=182803 RepID=A0A4Y2JFZ9_ARAVE|nr:hypothetical protein AVEN_265901-1 [Araneus ventricosus]